MKVRLLIFLILSLVLWSKGQAEDRIWVFDFEKDPVGQSPSGFKSAQTAGRGELAPWKVMAWKGAPSGEKVVLVKPNPKTNHGATFNVLWRPDLKLKDLTLSVYVRAVKGWEDQGGGLIWRVQDPDNYYVVRWNPLEDNFRLYYVKSGRRRMIRSSSFKANPKNWHHIKVIHQGNRIRCYFDGELKIEVQDKTFSQAGGIGLWTKADASTAFDLLEVEAK